MPDCYCVVPPVEWRRSQRTEASDSYYVRFFGSERRLFAGIDCAYYGVSHDGGQGGECWFRFCAVVLLLVYLYLLL